VKKVVSSPAMIFDNCKENQHYNRRKNVTYTYSCNTNGASKTQEASSIRIESETSVQAREFFILKRVDHASHGKGGP
jgi:hypothetical protein